VRIKLAAAFAAVAAVLMVPSAGASPAAGPSLASLSVASAPRSGRVVLTGTGFGDVKGSSLVSVGGQVAWTTRWSDTTIVAFAPESAPLGSDPVTVTVGGSGSNALPLTVQARQSFGRVAWRFQVDGQYVDLRPALGPDGGVVVTDSFGAVYSLTAQGALRWIVRGAGGSSPPSIGADGTVYVANGWVVTAIAPDGTVRWRFTEPTAGQGVIAGPTVGPDGNVYAVSDFGGLGAYALSAGGALLWSRPGNPPFAERGQIGVEVAFGPGNLYAGFDENAQAPTALLYSFTLTGTQRWAVTAGGGADDPFMQLQRQPAVRRDGGAVYETTTGGANGWALYSFNPANGAVNWRYSPYPSNGMSPPDVGPDGTIYLSRSLGYLDAVNPNGTQRWSFFDQTIVDYPIVDPQGRVVVAGDRPDFGVPGSARGWDAGTGRLLWQIDLPSENTGYQVLYSRPRFSADGRTVYFGTAMLGDASYQADQWSYVYAVDARAVSVPTAASVLGLRAHRTGNRVEVTWRTAQELGVAGFDLLRIEGTRATKVNGALVPARGVTAGAAYRVVDRLRAERPRYRLVAVALDGSRRTAATVATR
jgi:hypothetical protein